MLREFHRGSQKSSIVQAAEASERARARMRKIGRTPNGHSLWTEREDAIMREFYPDYRALQRKLRKRTYYALRGRAQSLKIQKRRHRWTAFEIARLRRLYPQAPKSEVMAIVPGMKWETIKARARDFGFRRRVKLKSTGFALLDQIRRRCEELGYSMVDLDAIARTRRYFSKAAWHVAGKLNLAKIVKAAAALDGLVRVEWRERA